MCKDWGTWMPAIVAIPEFLVLTLYLHSMASFPDFVSNIKQVEVIYSTSIPPEIVKKPTVFWWYQGNIS